MTTTAQKLTNKLAQAEAIANTITFDMEVNLLKNMVDAKSQLIQEVIDECDEALNSGDITSEENFKLNVMTRKVIRVEVKETF